MTFNFSIEPNFIAGMLAGTVLSVAGALFAEFVAGLFDRKFDRKPRGGNNA